jgi:predicted phage terminase large subunit-like protein
VVVDEAAFIKGEDWWFQELRPALSSPGRDGRAVFISTPNGTGNLFHNLFYRQPSERDWTDWESFTFPSTGNPHFDPAEGERARRELGGLVYSQEYLAEFVEMGGTLFRQDWFRYCDIKERSGVTVFDLDGRLVDWRDTTRYATVDLATSIRESADFTVIMSVASNGPDVIVLDVRRGRMEGPDIVPAVRRELESHDLGVVWIEKAGFQLSLIQEARRAGLPVRELAADRDKYARALPLQAKLEQGQVWFMAGSKWLPDLERELLSFTGVQSGHDDQVDALAYAVRVAGMSTSRRVDLSGWDTSEFGRTAPSL